MSIHVFLIPGAPVPKGRPRVYRGHAVTPKRTRDYERDVRAIAQARMVGQPVPSGPVSVTVNVFCADARRRDLDNCVKALTDALNGIAYEDDAQICVLYATKELDREYPRAVVMVETLAQEAA
jgi:crossover junction endodeoxyribonuclease RusA